MSCSYYTFRQGDYYCAKKQGYVNSDVYYKYCRNYDYDDCPIYKGDSTGCYLTSACVEARGLADDCRELTVLRRFRDGWLSRQEGGAADIQEYYRTAPAIVAAIHRREDAPAIWERLYQELVAPCVRLIDGGDLEGAYRTYKAYTLHLKEAYLEG